MYVHKNSFAVIAVAVFCAVVVSVVLVSYARVNFLRLFPVGSFAPANNDARKWVEAVKAGDQATAILYARRICGDCEMKCIPDSDYLKIAGDLRISTLILNNPLGRYDFLRWKDAFCINEFIGPSIDGKPSGMENMFSKLVNKVEYRRTAEGTPQALTMAEIISRGYGNSHEMSRLLSECAYQAGYDAQTVTMLDDSGNIAHVVCEIRGNGVSAVADPRFGKLWQNTTFARIAENPSDVSGVWPENILKSIKNHYYGMPSEFQDYKVYNQKLADKLKGEGIEGVPRFGADPRKRIEAYLQYLPTGEMGKVTYWRYPFYALMTQPDFPKDWKLDFNKIIDK